MVHELVRYMKSLQDISVFDHHQGACTEPDWSYICVKTFGEITSLFIMRLCGSVSWNGFCVARCAECELIFFLN